MIGKLFSDIDKELFKNGELLEWCVALRASSTGMGDPMQDEAIAAVRGYMRRRLLNWDQPESEWDRLVRALVEHSLREYHGDSPRQLQLEGAEKDPGEAA